MAAGVTDDDFLNFFVVFNVVHDGEEEADTNEEYSITHVWMFMHIQSLSSLVVAQFYQFNDLKGPFCRLYCTYYVFQQNLFVCLSQSSFLI